MKIDVVTVHWNIAFFRRLFDPWPWPLTVMEKSSWNINIRYKNYTTAKFDVSIFKNVENKNFLLTSDLWPNTMPLTFLIGLSPAIGINASPHCVFWFLFNENQLKIFWVIVEKLETSFFNLDTLTLAVTLTFKIRLEFSAHYNLEFTQVFSLNSIKIT